MALNITRGVVPCAQKVVVYGVEGIGKTTFASQFPDPLFVDVEGGTRHLDVARVDHALEPAALATAGHDVEAQVLARAVKWHAERRVLLNGHRTVVVR